MYLELSDLGYFAHWYYPVIAELSYLDGFQKNSDWIRNSLNFSLSKKQIEEALNYLEENNFLKGSLALDKQVKVPDELRSYIYKNYVLESIEMSRRSIDELSIDKRESFNLTVSVSNEKYQLAQNMIRNFRHELHEVLSGDDDCDHVIQVNMQLFEMAQSLKLKKENNKKDSNYEH